MILQTHSCKTSLF